LKEVISIIWEYANVKVLGRRTYLVSTPLDHPIPGFYRVAAAYEPRLEALDFNSQEVCHSQQSKVPLGREKFPTKRKISPIESDKKKEKEINKKKQRSDLMQSETRENQENQENQEETAQSNTKKRKIGRILFAVPSPFAWDLGKNKNSQKKRRIGCKISPRQGLTHDSTFDNVNPFRATYMSTLRNVCRDTRELISLLET